MEWRLADAKNRLSEVVNLALSEGPQRIIRRNDEVVVLASNTYDALMGEKPSFKAFLMQCNPNFDSLEIKRNHSKMRDIEL